MNRQFLGMLAVTLTTAFVQTGRLDRGQPYPPPGPYPTGLAYPTRPAVYMNTNPYASGVYPATMAADAARRGSTGRLAPTLRPAPALTAVYGDVRGESMVAATVVYMYGDAGATRDGGLRRETLRRRLRRRRPARLRRTASAVVACLARGLWRRLRLLWWRRLRPRGERPLSTRHGDGGCCLPRWFDVHAEWLFWKRDYDDSLPFSSTGILGPGCPERQSTGLQ